MLVARILPDIWKDVAFQSFYDEPVIDREHIFLKRGESHQILQIFVEHVEAEVLGLGGEVDYCFKDDVAELRIDGQNEFSANFSLWHRYVIDPEKDSH